MVMKTLIVCASKYGSTKVIGEWIAERLGFDCFVTDVKGSPDPDGFDLLILGSGIYEDRVLPELSEFIDKNIKILEEKKKIIFGVCLDTNGFYVNGKIGGGWEYIRPIIEKFQNPPIHAGLLHGEINPSKLTPDDEKRLMIFYNKILRRDYTSVPYRTNMNKEEAWNFAEKIREKLAGKIY